MMRVLIVEDDPTLRSFLAAEVADQGLSAEVLERGDDAIAAIGKRDYDLVLSDVKLPGADGLAVLKAARARLPECQVVLMTAYATVEIAVNAMKAGACEFLQKPFTAEILEGLFRAANERLELKRTIDVMERERPTARMVGQEGGLSKIHELIRRIAPGDSGVLIFGESGVGKELVAQEIHRLSGRARKRMVSLHIPAIPETLVEAELFGYERGAFTGANKSRVGLMELADGGTIFLDEIGDLAMPTQSKLLRVLQERRFRRLGANEEISVDVRILCATNRDLAEDVRSGRFREDLYYRLNVVPLRVPPLRERPDDVPSLVEYFITRNARRLKSRVESVSPEVLEAYQRYAWPGNVRELENVILRALALANGPILEQSFLEENPGMTHGVSAAVGQIGFSLSEYLAREEQAAIRAALELEHGVKSRAAARLGLKRTTLIEKMSKYGMQS